MLGAGALVAPVDAAAQAARARCGHPRRRLPRRVETGPCPRVERRPLFPRRPSRVPVRGGGLFPVHRIYCIGRNFADHAREMARGRACIEGRTRHAGVLPQARGRHRRRRRRSHPPGTRDL